MTLLSNIATMGTDIFIKYWKENTQIFNDWFGFGIYSSIGLFFIIVITIRQKLTFSFNIKSSKALHHDMINCLVKAPINLFHDIIPRGMIFNRLSKDLEEIDRWYPYNFGLFLFSFTNLLLCFAVNTYYYYWSIAFLPISLLISYAIFKKFIHPSRELSRYESISRTPIANMVAETINGVVTIRSLKFEKTYLQNFQTKLDYNFNVKLFKSGITNWFGLYANLSAIIFLLFQITIIVYFKDNFSNGTVAVMLNTSLILQNSLFESLNMYSQLENKMVAYERCNKYTIIPPENGYLQESKYTENWPSEGRISFNNYSVSYRPNTPLVLKNLNFAINPKEKIGIIGRTGSGKSTICLCLFRILDPVSGTIFIDDNDICNMNILTLRKKLTIIPQDPCLVKGTLRYNIDPISEFNTVEILDLINAIGFDKEFSNDDDDLQSSSMLDFEIEEGGSNLSVGQKQVICIMRAFLRVRKIYN